MVNLKIRTIGKYNGHSFKPNGSVDFGIKLSYEELVNYYMKLPLLRSANTEVVARIGDEEPFSLGTFMLHSYSMDRDGEGTIKFNSLYDHVEPDGLNALVSEKDSLIKFLFKAEIEDVEEEE
jgi:hypothetical protein